MEKAFKDRLKEYIEDIFGYDPALDKEVKAVPTFLKNNKVLLLLIFLKVKKSPILLYFIH